MSAPSPLDYAAWRRTRLGETTERLELRAVLELAGCVRGLTALDVGAGDGAYAIALAQRGARASAVDVSSSALAQATRNALQGGVMLAPVAADARQLPFRAGRFDLVLAVTTLCFVGSPGAAVREMARVLRPGGRLIVGELGALSVWGTWRRLRGRLGSPIWRRAHFWTPATLRRLVGDAGLEPGRLAGAVYYPPWGVAAAALAPFDALLGRATAVGAAFLVLEATKPIRPVAA